MASNPATDVKSSALPSPCGGYCGDCRTEVGERNDKEKAILTGPQYFSRTNEATPAIGQHCYSFNREFEVDGWKAATKVLCRNTCRKGEGKKGGGKRGVGRLRCECERFQPPHCTSGVKSTTVYRRPADLHEEKEDYEIWSSPSLCPLVTCTRARACSNHATPTPYTCASNDCWSGRCCARSRAVDTGTNSFSIFTILPEDTLSFRTLLGFASGGIARLASAETPCADSLTQKLSSHLFAISVSRTVRFSS